jgi:hypothetical protein
MRRVAGKARKPLPKLTVSNVKLSPRKNDDATKKPS